MAGPAYVSGGTGWRAVDAPMSETSIISRERMVDDANMCTFTFNLECDYIRPVRQLAAFLGRSPDQGPPKICASFTARDRDRPSAGTTVTALRLFFKVMLDRTPTWHLEL